MYIHTYIHIDSRRPVLRAEAGVVLGPEGALVDHAAVVQNLIL